MGTSLAFILLLLAQARQSTFLTRRHSGIMWGRKKEAWGCGMNGWCQTSILTSSAERQGHAHRLILNGVPYVLFIWNKECWGELPEPVQTCENAGSVLMLRGMTCVMQARARCEKEECDKQGRMGSENLTGCFRERVGYAGNMQRLGAFLNPTTTWMTTGLHRRMSQEDMQIQPVCVCDLVCLSWSGPKLEAHSRWE